jgi:hypothetical protein|nr:MAG TPA: Protein of unknown function (DUF1642) [Caudoviricetes sp.]
MNKQELIEKYEKLEGVCKDPGAEIARLIFLEDLRELDEPQKVTVPQFVADYIKDAKYYEWDLDDAFDHITEESEESEIYEWFYTLGNIDVFARAWLDGYEVEKEKRYLVKMKGISSNMCYLNRVGNKWIIAGIDEHTGMNIYTKHTKKELEDASFGWVFDCPGIEIEEVE